MIDSYLTLVEPVQHKITRKKSRFLALVFPVRTPDAIDEKLRFARKTYHDATHHCSAYRLLVDDALVEGSNDDGEPSGSAGQPMLHQLAGRDLLNVLAVVVRYYGGTKLGVGGLVRAYADAVSEALDDVHIHEQLLLDRILIRCPAEVHSSVMSISHRFSAQIIELAFEGSVRVITALPPSRTEAYRAALIEGTGARACVEVLHD